MKEFATISTIGAFDLVFATNVDSEFKTMQDVMLYFWCYSAEAIPAADLPFIQLEDEQHDFTVPVRMLFL